MFVGRAVITGYVQLFLLFKQSQGGGGEEYRIRRASERFKMSVEAWAALDGK